MDNFKPLISQTVRIMRRIKWALLAPAVLCVILVPSCKQDKLRVPLEHDKVNPGVVSDVKVENVPGGAKLDFVLPKDLDLLYVQADYEIRPGIKEQSVTSMYDHALIVQGFGDTAIHEVALRAVDRSGNKSDPVMVKVRPLTPPVQQAFDSLDYERDFGGIHVTLANESKANIVITVIVKDSTGAWVDYDKEYTSLPGVDFSVRGLPAVSTDFGVFIRDRWDNHSDTMTKTITPFFEMEMDKNKFKAVTLPDDGSNTWSLAGLWDDNTTSHTGIHSNDSQGFPVHYQFSLGVKARLSRFRIWQIYDGREYSSGNIKTFEIWGSNQPASDGSFNGWTLLQTCEVVKPSGLPSGALTDEDIATATAGDEFVIPINAPAVQYIRINILSTFASPPGSSTGGAWLVEVGFWGTVEP